MLKFSLYRVASKHLLSFLLMPLALLLPQFSLGGELLDAVRSQDRDRALALLKQGVEVNQTMTDGSTPLHWAVYGGDRELVANLIAAGADVKLTNDYGSSPMSEAALIADADIIRLLLAAGADVNSPTLEGQTALMSVARSNHVAAARLLLEHGAAVNAVEDWRGQSALMWAAAYHQAEMLQVLIEYGADVNAHSKIEQWERMVTAEPRPQNRPLGGFSALHFAAREGCAACIPILVATGARIDAVDPNGITPLLLATLNGRFNAAAALIEAGADPDRWDRWGRAPLYSTVDFNTVPRGGRPDRPSLDETTAVQVAAMLLEAGANPNMQLKLFPPYRSLGNDRGGDSMLTTGTTPLIRAAKGGDVDMVKLLLEYGALANLKNWSGYSPIMAAAGLGTTTIDTRARFRDEQRCIESARLILAAGADINAGNDNGQRALHGAALWGWNAMVKFLIDKGADMNARDNFGMTALDTAMGRAGGTGRFRSNTQVQPETAALLQALGAEHSAQQ